MIEKNNMFNQIVPGIYQGSYLHGLDAYDTLNDIDGIVSLCNPSMAIEMPYMYCFPIDDGPYPGIDWLETVMEAIDSLRKRGKSVYIHCWAGISRSVMVTAAYLMKSEFWSLDEAMETIAKVNPQLNPAPAFMRLLKEWECKLKGC